MKNRLQHISIAVSRIGSSTAAFLLSIAVVLVWLSLGPYFHFSEVWLIAITVISDVIIFVMVFSIQNTQFRDSKAIQLKLNELISADQKARDSFIGLETLTDGELASLDEEFKQLLAKMDDHSAMHRLHASIKREKARRPSFYEQAEDFMDKILEPLSGSNHPSNHKKH
ncbi:MAG TPA: low affinity iron permease family protein [Candidatus Saccharimonadales bacterium]|nr:low affinity iron permease family protein [Candidatus Saccharimonadales bacterium]